MDNLKHLIAAYFYQLWDQVEYSSWEESVDDFVRRSPTRAPRVPEEIDSLLLELEDDDAVLGRLVGWGFSYSPPGGARAWLGAVRDRIEGALGTNEAGA